MCQFLPAIAGAHHNVFPDSQFLKRPDHLIGAGQTPAGGLVRRFSRNILISKDNSTCFRFIDAIDDIEQSGFAGAVGADQTQNMSFGQIKNHIGQGLEAAETFADALNFQYHSNTFRSLKKRSRSQPTAPDGTNRTIKRRKTPAMARCRFLKIGLVRR